MSRFPTFLNQKPPLEHDVLRNWEDTAVKHGTHFMREPVVQSVAAMGVANKLYTKSNFGKGYNTDMKLLQRTTGHECYDFRIRPWPPQFR